MAPSTAATLPSAPRRGRLWPLVATVLAAAGIAARLAEFGSHSFWNDEAWVALSTRVQGLGQFWLSLGVTPREPAAAIAHPGAT